MDLQILMRTLGQPTLGRASRRLRRLYGAGRYRAAAARRGSAAQRVDPRPLGRLGRRLVADLDPYLEFFAIARG